MDSESEQCEAEERADPVRRAERGGDRDRADDRERRDVGGADGAAPGADQIPEFHDVLVDLAVDPVVAAKVAPHEAMERDAVRVDQRRRGSERRGGETHAAVTLLIDGADDQKRDAQREAPVHVRPRELDGGGGEERRRTEARRERKERHRHRKDQGYVGRARRQKAYAEAPDGQESHEQPRRDTARAPQRRRDDEREIEREDEERDRGEDRRAAAIEREGVRRAESPLVHDPRVSRLDEREGVLPRDVARRKHPAARGSHPPDVGVGYRGNRRDRRGRRVERAHQHRAVARARHDASKRLRQTSKGHPRNAVAGGPRRESPERMTAGRSP